MVSPRDLGRGAVGVILLLVAGPAQAQDAGNGFLFRAPAGQVSLRIGFDSAIAGSDVFAQVVEELTLNQGDFSSMTFASDVDYGLTPRLDLRFSFAFSRSTTPSDYRHFVDNNRQEIQQTTGFDRLPLTASLKAYLANPGRSVGHFAWIPSRYAPYVGAGGGAMWYRFEQRGDFVDFTDFKVFPDHFLSEGWTPTLQTFVGTDVSLNPRFAVTVEGRYQWARAQLSRDFVDFQPINLSGFALTAGFSIRY